MLEGRLLQGERVTLGGRECQVGEQVLCRHNDTWLGLRNGMLGTIVELEDDALLVRDRTRTVHRVPFAYASERLDYGYALTGHAAQGITVDRAFVHLPGQAALQEWGYVACSRARLETRLYLADHPTIRRETPLLREPHPAERAERTARALRRLAAEPLALDQRGGHGDTILNRISQEQEQLDRRRQCTTDQLGRAQRELQHLHRWNRGHRVQLGAEITLHEKELDRCDEKGQQLRRTVERRLQFLAFTQRRDELTRSLAPEPPRRSLAMTIEREPPGRGLEL